MIGAALALVLIVRSCVPAVGVLFLGWPADRVLVLFFLDTVLGIGALAAAMTITSALGDKGKGRSRVVSVIRALVGSVVLIAFIAIPLGAPLLLMLSNTDFSLALMLHDWSFQHSLEIQALASFGWCATLVWRLRSESQEQIGIAPLFGLVLLRWLILVGLAFTGLPMMLGRYGPHLLVVVFVAAMVVSEINPLRFLSLMPAASRAKERK